MKKKYVDDLIVPEAESLSEITYEVLNTTFDYELETMTDLADMSRYLMEKNPYEALKFLSFKMAKVATFFKFKLTPDSLLKRKFWWMTDRRTILIARVA